MGRKIETLWEAKKIIILGTLSLAGGALAAYSEYDVRQNVEPKLDYISQEANSQHPDISLDQLQKAKQINIVSATKPEVIKAKDLIDQHQAYLDNYKSLSESLNVREENDILGITFGGMIGGMSVIIVVGDVLKGIRKDEPNSSLISQPE